MVTIQITEHSGNRFVAKSMESVQKSSPYRAMAFEDVTFTSKDGVHYSSGTIDDGMDNRFSFTITVDTSHTYYTVAREGRALRCGRDKGLVRIHEAGIDGVGAVLRVDGQGASAMLRLDAVVKYRAADGLGQVRRRERALHVRQELAQRQQMAQEKRQKVSDAVNALHQQEIAVAREQARRESTSADLNAHLQRMQETEQARVQLHQSLEDIRQQLENIEHQRTGAQGDQSAMEQKTIEMQNALIKARAEASAENDRLMVRTLQLSDLRHGLSDLERDEAHAQQDQAQILREQERHQLGVHRLYRAEIPAQEPAYKFTVDRRVIPGEMYVFNLGAHALEILPEHPDLRGLSGPVQTSCASQGIS